MSWDDLIPCMACPDTVFKDRAVYAEHVKTKWHMYNTNCRMMGNPTMSEEAYLEKFGGGTGTNGSKAKDAGSKAAVQETPVKVAPAEENATVIIMFNYHEERWSHRFSVKKGTTVWELKQSMVKPGSPKEDLVSFSLKKGMIRVWNFDTIESDDTFEFQYCGPEEGQKFLDRDTLRKEREEAEVREREEEEARRQEDRKRQEEERQKQLEEEAKQKEEEERRKKEEEEAKRQFEEDWRKRQEEEAKRQEEEKERKKKQEEEARQQEEERRKRQEEEAKRKKLEEAKRQEEERRKKQEEEAKRQEEERRKKQEDEARRQEEEQRRKEQEEEERRQEAERRRKQEEDARRLQAEEEQRERELKQAAASQEPVEVSIHIDRGLELKTVMMLKPSTPIGTVKERIASDDPTGQMTAQDFALIDSTSGRVLTDDELIGHLTELDLKGLEA